MVRVPSELSVKGRFVISSFSRKNQITWYFGLLLWLFPNRISLENQLVPQVHPVLSSWLPAGWAAGLLDTNYHHQLATGSLVCTSKPYLLRCSCLVTWGHFQPHPVLSLTCHALLSRAAEFLPLFPTPPFYIWTTEEKQLVQNYSVVRFMLLNPPP